MPSGTQNYPFLPKAFQILGPQRLQGYYTAIDLFNPWHILSPRTHSHSAPASFSPQWYIFPVQSLSGWHLPRGKRSLSTRGASPMLSPMGLPPSPPISGKEIWHSVLFYHIWLSFASLSGSVPLKNFLHPNPPVILQGQLDWLPSHLNN